MLKSKTAAIWSLCCFALSISAIEPSAVAQVKKTAPAPGPPKLSALDEYKLAFINGLWQSDWGPVTLVAEPKGDGTFKLTGHWIQRGSKGVIKEGSFDPHSGLLQFNYYQSWNNCSGQAALQLSEDKRQLSGRWSQSNGDSGSWTISRPSGFKLPPRPAVAATSPVKALPPVISLPPVRAVSGIGLITQIKALPSINVLPPVVAPVTAGGGYDELSLVNVSTVPVPGAAKDAAIEIYDEGCKKRLSLGADMLFAFDRSDIGSDAQKTLEALGPVIQKFGNHPVSVEGHTDAVGTDEYNQQLSQRRAATVKEWLTGHGFLPGASVSVVGFGEKQPVAPNMTGDGTDYPEGRARNRRVEVVVDTCITLGDSQPVKANAAGAEADIKEGMGFASAARHEDAVRSLKRAVQIDPMGAEAYYQLGKSYFHLDRLVDAGKAFQKCLERDPGHANAYFDLGLTYRRSAQYDAMATCFQQVIRLNPDSVGAYTFLGSAFVSQTKYPEAILALEEAVKRKSVLPETYRELAVAYEKVNRPADAYRQREVARQLESRSAAEDR